MAAEQVDKVKMLADRISPILHGHKPEIQGAVLAEAARDMALRACGAG
jgi:hypothetical protein